jgi:pyrroloquinoline quinone (PQQ) biosynthesis protein C
LLSETIKQELRARADEMASSHPAVVQARQGKVDSSNVANYLASLQFLFSQTVRHLEQAKAQAVRMGHAELVPFLERKIAEETGHEEWAENDLFQLSRHRGVTLSGRPLPAVVELVDYLDDLTETDPRLYIVYALSTEYFTVLAGPTWIRLLTEHCGVPLAALTAATKHIEADQAHAAHGFSILDELIRDPGLTPEARRTVDRMICLFDQFFREVVSSSN